MPDVKLGIVDRTVLVFIPDPASTDGSGKTGLVAANLTVSYTRVETDNDVVVTDVTSSLNNLAALTSTHNDWGVLEVSNTLAPGLYRLDIADAVFASGAWYAVVYVMITTSAAAASPILFTLVAFDALDTVRLGLTALPNAAADAAGGLVISDAGGLDADAQRADVAAILVDTGTTLDTALAAVQSDTNDIQTRLPASLTGGRMNANVEAIDNATTAGNNATLNLKQLNVVNSAGSAIVATSTGANGSGLAATGNGTGHGIDAGSGSGATGNGIHTHSNATNGHGLSVNGNGTGAGLVAEGGATGPGADLGSRAGSDQPGLILNGDTSRAGLEAYGGTSGHGIYGQGGAVDGSGLAAGASAAPAIIGRVLGGDSAGMALFGAATSAGLYVEGGATAGPGLQAQGGTNGDGIQAVGDGTGVDIRGDITGNLSGSIGSVATDGITATSIATDAIDADALATDAVDEIVDQVWDELIAGHAGVGSTGEALSNAGAAGTPPTTGAIADAVWDEVRAGHVGAGSFGQGVVVATNSDKTGYALTAAYDAAKTAAQAGDAMTLTSGERNSIATALLDLANGVETGVTLRQAQRLELAALAGKLSGAATTTVTFRNAVADSKDRIVATVDADGNRTAISTDLT